MGKRVISRREEYNFGNYKEIALYPVYSGSGRKVREEKAKITRKAQKELNRKMRIRKIHRLLNGNFNHKDYFVTVTYSEKFVPSTIEEAQADYREFMKKLRKLYKKAEKTLKYMAWIEKGVENGRLHHHLVISGGVPREQIEDIFQKGFCDCKRLRPQSDDLLGLAEYFAKDPKGKRTFTCSKNLDRTCLIPQVKDNSVAKHKIRKIIENYEDKEMFEKLYPGYELVKCENRINEYSRAISVNILLRKKGCYGYDLG